MSKIFFFFFFGGGRKTSASSPLLHVTCRPRGTFFKVGVRGGGLKYLRSDRACKAGGGVNWRGVHGQSPGWGQGAEPREAQSFLGI